MFFYMMYHSTSLSFSYFRVVTHSLGCFINLITGITGIVTANLIICGFRVTIMEVYAPNYDTTVEEKDTFYSKLEDFLLDIC